MFFQDLALLNNQEVRIIDTFLPQMTKTSVRIRLLSDAGNAGNTFRAETRHEIKTTNVS